MADDAADELKALLEQALTELRACADETTLRAWNTKYFGDKGLMKAALAKLNTIPKEQRGAYGKEANRVKEDLTRAYDAALADAKEKALQASLTSNPLDVSLPGRGRPRGRLHPATQILRQIYSIFGDLGFQVYRTREVETDELNFEFLNMPAHHPARDMWDTFFTTTPGVVLRTHTSPGQIHIMREAAGKPIRVILPGMCYRNEAISTRSEIQFYQVEGLVIGEGVTMADLKGTITAFARRMFGPERQVRIRSSYFPFTEPSIEVDIDWPKDDPNRDRLTKGTGWLEILGAGMVHPNVLRAGGYDPDKVTGFAFGMGPQRMLMLKHAIDDIRLFWQNDLRFLRQFTCSVSATGESHGRELQNQQRRLQGNSRTSEVPSGAIIDPDDLQKTVERIRQIFKDHRTELVRGQGLWTALNKAEQAIEVLRGNAQSLPFDADSIHVVNLFGETLQRCLTYGVPLNNHLGQLTTGTTDHGISKPPYESHLHFYKDFEFELFIASWCASKSCAVQLSKESNDPRGEMIVESLRLEAKHPDGLKQVLGEAKEFNKKLRETGEYGVFATGLEDMFGLDPKTVFDSQEDFNRWLNSQRAEIEQFGQQFIEQIASCERIILLLQVTTFFVRYGRGSKAVRQGNAFIYDTHSPERSNEHTAAQKVAKAFNGEAKTHSDYLKIRPRS